MDLEKEARLKSLREKHGLTKLDWMFVNAFQLHYSLEVNHHRNCNKAFMNALDDTMDEVLLRRLEEQPKVLGKIKKWIDLPPSKRRQRVPDWNRIRLQIWPEAV